MYMNEKRSGEVTLQLSKAKAKSHAVSNLTAATLHDWYTNGWYELHNMRCIPFIFIHIPSAGTSMLISLTWLHACRYQKDLTVTRTRPRHSGQRPEGKTMVRNTSGLKEDFDELDIEEVHTLLLFVALHLFRSDLILLV